MRNFLLINDVEGEEVVDEIIIVEDGMTSRQRTAFESDASEEPSNIKDTDSKF